MKGQVSILVEDEEEASIYTRKCEVSFYMFHSSRQQCDQCDLRSSQLRDLHLIILVFSAEDIERAAERSIYSTHNLTTTSQRTSSKMHRIG